LLYYSSFFYRCSSSLSFPVLIYPSYLHISLLFFLLLSSVFPFLIPTPSITVLFYSVISLFFSALCFFPYVFFFVLLFFPTIFLFLLLQLSALWPLTLHCRT
jgi:hypothetical protein